MDVWGKLEGAADALLTTKELGEVLGRTAGALKKDRRNGRGVPFVRVGLRALRYRAGDVREFLKARRVETAFRAGGCPASAGVLSGETPEPPSSSSSSSSSSSKAPLHADSAALPHGRAAALDAATSANASMGGSRTRKRASRSPEVAA